MSFNRKCASIIRCLQAVALLGCSTVALLGQIAAQTITATSPSTTRPIGVIAAIDLARRQITLRLDTGTELLIVLEDDTKFLQILPAEKDLKNAKSVSISDIVVGDRILVRGRPSENGKVVTASSVVVMTKADLSKKQEADREEWRKRGISGTITALNGDKREITVSTHKLEGAKEVVISVPDKSSLLRYAEDSVKFSDARASTFTDLVLGDQIRALGDKSEDGTRFTAEKLIAGTFRHIAGTVLSTDVGQQTIKLTDLDTKKPVLVKVNPDSNLRKLPPFVAQMIAWRLSGGTSSGARMTEEGSARPFPSNGRPPVERPQGTGGKSGPPDFQQMLERMPAVSLGELSPGEAVIVLSTKGTDSERVTAITLLTGVEPLLTKSPGGGRQMMVGFWNLDMNMNLGFQ